MLCLCFSATLFLLINATELLPRCAFQSKRRLANRRLCVQCKCRMELHTHNCSFQSGSVTSKVTPRKTRMKKWRWKRRKDRRRTRHRVTNELQTLSRQLPVVVRVVASQSSRSGLRRTPVAKYDDRTLRRRRKTDSLTMMLSRWVDEIRDFQDSHTMGIPLRTGKAKQWS